MAARGCSRFDMSDVGQGLPSLPTYSHDWRINETAQAVVDAKRCDDHHEARFLVRVARVTACRIPTVH